MTSGGSHLNLSPGSPEWKKMREYATVPIPGRRSALYYLNEKILGKGPLVPMTYRAHYAMCLFAEGATGIPEIDNARVKLTLVPRGVGKSSLITKALPIQRILRDRNASTGLANEVKDLAESFLGDIKSEFEQNELLRALWPECIPPDLRATTWKADRIIVQRDKHNPTSPSVLATGVGGTVTGVHMGAWVCDDLLSQNAAEAAHRGSTGEIEATNRWITKLQPLLTSPKVDPIWIIGTRWWAGDSYEFVEDFWGHGEPAREIVWALPLPAQTLVWDYDRDGKPEKIERPPETQVHKVRVRGEIAIFSSPALDENGRAIFPERYNEEELATMQMEDPVFYAGQYLLNPTAGGSTTFDPDWLRYYDIDGQYLVFRDGSGDLREVPISQLTMLHSVDPAFSKKSSSARSALPVVGTDGKLLFLMEDFAERLDSEDDIAARVLSHYTRYGAQRIFVETIVAQVAVANAIRRRFREEGLPDPPIEEIRSHGKQRKEMRIYGLEHYFKRGIFYIHKSHRRFLQEYLSFPRGLLKDILDALAFQKDEWEKIFSMTNYGRKTPRDREVAEQRAIERVRSAYGRRGRRRA